MGKKTLIVGLAFGAAASLAASLLAPTPDAETPGRAEPQAQIIHTASNPLFESLPTRQQMGPTRGELFFSKEPPKPAPPASVVAPPAPPPPPSMPYRVAGLLAYDGELKVVLARGDRVFTVQTGDVLDGGYRVESVEPDQVTLLYVALAIRQELPVNTTLKAPPRQALAKSAFREANGDPAGAQLRWEGPPRVQSGDPFDVALKLTTSEPVRSSPLQLTYDAKLLEPVAVRSGGFFADGEFTYRINRAGSIVIGASRTAAVAADTEFLVVTFRPIRAGQTTELKVSPLLLRSNAGRIVPQPPAAFRTNIAD